MSKSSQHKLDNNRKPRVHITYDVEVNGAKKERELPFVVGVLANLSGKPAEALPRLAERPFVEIDTGNFDDVLAGAKPRVAFPVEDILGGKGATFDVDVSFRSMADFEPDRLVENLAERIEPLKKLLEERRQLSDLLNGMESTPRFGEALQAILNDQARRDQLRGEVHRAAGEPEEA